ncbi:hypothetical protein LCGC14_2109280, partial [marine sediment metagenome]
RRAMMSVKIGKAEGVGKQRGVCPLLGDDEKSMICLCNHRTETNFGQERFRNKSYFAVLFR